MDLPSILHRTIPLVLRAGEMVRAEFLRPEGPRGSGHKAPVDTEIEIFLRDALRDVLRVPFVGEETPPVLDGDASRCWLVDPHDGTSEFLRGARGSSVSVALLRDGVPVLGVVHAPLSPDRGSDLIGWAEGMDHLIRNGVAIRPGLVSRGLTQGDIVLLAYRSYARPATNMRRVAPARFVSSNSIAYRLARVAAGDAVATASRQSRLVRLRLRGRTRAAARRGLRPGRRRGEPAGLWTERQRRDGQMLRGRARGRGCAARPRLVARPAARDAARRARHAGAAPVGARARPRDRLPRGARDRRGARDPTDSPASPVLAWKRH